MCRSSVCVAVVASIASARLPVVRYCCRSKLDVLEAVEEGVLQYAWKRTARGCWRMLAMMDEENRPYRASRADGLDGLGGGGRLLRSASAEFSQDALEVFLFLNALRLGARSRAYGYPRWSRPARRS